MITVEEAFKRIANHINSTTKSVKKLVINATGFVLSEDVYSPINMPPFRQSAMDGYALYLHNDVNYTLVGEVKAGDGHHPIIKSGEAVRIFTGSAVPDTANTVIMQEKVTRDGDQLKVAHTVSVNENIRPLGEQIQKGELALKKGTKLSPAAVGYLTTLGIAEVAVFSKPSIAIITTGDELINVGQPLDYGKIYESNSWMLQSALQSLNYNRITLKKVKDDYASTVTAIKKALSENDVVLISGGISVGDYDFVGKALAELEVEEVFYKVKQKPGKPLFFGKKDNTAVFALPGNPASALSCFYIYVYPTLQRLSGEKDFSLNRMIVKSAAKYFKKGDRAQFLKAYLKNGKASILEGQSSAMLHTFALANVLVYMPEDVNNILIGDPVEVFYLPT
jgi:molybdopterin molybdotransferase